MPNFSSNDILVAEANLLYAPVGTALPDETTVDWNSYDDWTDWVHLGYTDAVSNLTYNYEEYTYTPEQATSPLVRRKVSETLTFSFALAQFSGDHLALVTGGTAADTAAGASQKGYTLVEGGGDTDIDEYMFALEGWRKAAGVKQPVRIFFHKAIIVANGDIPFGKQNAAIVPVQVTAVPDTNKAVGKQLFAAHIVTAAATS